MLVVLEDLTDHRYGLGRLNFGTKLDLAARPHNDFDEGALGSRFGVGWTPSTDEIMGGSWAGAMFFPGAAPMSPADVSAGSGLRLLKMSATVLVGVALALGARSAARAMKEATPESAAPLIVSSAGGSGEEEVSTT